MKPLRIAIKILASAFGVVGMACLVLGLFAFDPPLTFVGIVLIGAGLLTNYCINGV